MIDWSFVVLSLLEQEGGSLIAPMALARPLHPIDNRSRNKRRNLWVGRCVSSWWPWFPSRSSVLIYMYIYICMYIPYTSSVVGRIYNGSVIQYWRSCTPSRSLRESAVPGLNATFCFLWFTKCVLLFDKNLILGCLWLSFGICFKQHFDTRYLVFYNTSPPRMFLSLDLLSEYRIQHGANGPLYVTSSYSQFSYWSKIDQSVSETALLNVSILLSLINLTNWNWSLLGQILSQTWNMM